MSKICSVEWCDKTAVARGLCGAHYQQVCRTGRIRPQRGVEDSLGEKWKNIPGFDGFYQVSNFGRVRTFKGNKGNREKLPVLLSEHLNQSGYNQLSFRHRGEARRLLIHRLVAQAFIPNPENKPFINHIDGVRSNNHFSNLEWVTQSENMRHSYDILKQPLPPGNPKPVKCVETGVVYQSAAAAQRETGVSKVNIGKVALAKDYDGRRLGHTNLTAGGYHWEFVNN